MMSINEAKEIMKYFGFNNTNIEPTLCEYENQVSIFATYKTKYGHLSRIKQFSDKEELKEFLKSYLWYRKNIKDENLIIEFDDYEKINPKIKFIYNGNELNNDTLFNYIIIDTPVEELTINENIDENNKLLDILFLKIENACEKIKNIEEELKKVIDEYQSMQKEYNTLLGLKDEVIKINFNEFEKFELNQKLEGIRNDVSEKTFIKYFDELLNILENTLLDPGYLDNMYLKDYYKEQTKILEEKINEYNSFIEKISKEKNKLFKSKKEMSFDEYINENPLRINNVDKNTIVINEQTEVQKNLVEWKNNSIDDLKIIHGITKKEEKIEQENVIKKEVDKETLLNYFMNLNLNERNELLLLSSPLKELINLINNMDINNDRVFTILNEPYLLNKFKDIYVILSNEDNFAPSRKYLKMIKLDSLEDFIKSIDDFVKKFNVKPFTLSKNTTLKFKIGVLLKTGYINASISDNYPVNNRGDNNYYITNLVQDISIYYSPYIIKIDAYGNLIVEENDNVITFDINNKALTNKEEIKINNYMLRTKKEGNNIKYKFILFNKKSYITSNLENGEHYE